MLAQGRLGEVRRDWKVITRLCQAVHRTYGLVGVFVNERRPEESYNLPLVLAYGILDQVMDDLVEGGAFPRPGGRPQLKQKMMASKIALPWQNYDLVDAGRDARNNLAHQGVLVSKEDCLKFIQAIGSELVAWGILETA